LKVFIALMISLSLENISFSQINISNLSLTDTTLPIAYQGVDNILSISGLRNGEKVSLNSIYSSTRLTKNGVNSYIYLSSIMDRNDTVYLWDRDIIIAKQPFKIKKLNEPKVSLGNIRDSFITILQAINNPYLSVYIPDNYFKYKMHIISFELFKIVNKDTISLYSSEIQNGYNTIMVVDFNTGKETFKIEKKESRITKNFNERLTSYQLHEIRRMKSGDRLLFKEIVVSGQNGCYRKFYDYQIQIK
jgi:hypothetical protein